MFNEQINKEDKKEATEVSAAKDFDLPDWSGQSPHHSSMSNDEWIAYCRSNLPRLRAQPGHRLKRLEHGVSVEFRL